MTKCSICGFAIKAAEAVHVCDLCRNGFHQECWDGNGGCGTPGCANVPQKVESKDSGTDEVTYWGATTKVCPACGETIKVNELKCPWCHEEFKTAEPMTADEMKQGLVVRRGDVRVRNIALAIFIGGILGFTAPVNLVLGGAWYLQNRAKLQTESPAHGLLAVAGLVFSGCYMLLFLVGIFRS